jgi:hypothetical protein
MEDLRKTSSRTTEADITKVVAYFLMQDGYSLKAEVPSLGQSVDLVAMQGNELMFIEVKKSDWRRALRQCKAHHMVADFICVAVGQVNVSKSLLREAEQLGYGIIHYSPVQEKCTWIAQPSRLFDFWEPERLRIESRINNIPEYA